MSRETIEKLYAEGKIKDDISPYLPKGTKLEPNKAPPMPELSDYVGFVQYEKDGEIIFQQFE